MIEPIYSYGLLALELCPGQQMQKSALCVSEASELGALIAEDLRTWIAPHTDIDISIAGASFDPVEILRHTWPVHAEIARLTQLSPKSAEARLLSIGADAQTMPAGLQPDAIFQGGPLRLVPIVLSGPSSSMAQVKNKLEEDLMERGMAGAGTALLAQQLFSVAIEHARYMTLNDLVALMAMQYQHNGLEPVWPLIETALFAPKQTAWLDTAPEPLIYFENNTAHIALLDYHQWTLMQVDLKAKTAEQLEQQFQMFQMRQRQIAALLEAHGIEVHFDFCPEIKTAKQILQN
ncbi:MAG: hypothetical protein KA350_03395 [Arenimonas sp.]|nr:hypothetical protein [Arenimonas sp.]